MDGYYELLGLAPGASPLEIKKAYFKLVRQYSPESDPEQFQRIREAYEQLKNAENAPEQPQFPPVTDPWAEKMLRQIHTLSRDGNAELCRDTCEEAYRLFPDNIQFLYFLTIAQRKSGNTGKAVKNAELLVKKEPENKWFQKQLAICYKERGFNQKAYTACERAYELGCRDRDFLLTYAVQCSDYGQFDKGIQLLLFIIRQDKKWAREEIRELVWAYMCLIKMNKNGTEDHLPEILERLSLTLEQYGFFMAEYLTEMSLMISRAGMGMAAGEAQKVRQIFDLMEKLCHTDSEKERINDAREEFNYQRFMDDERIGEAFKRGYEAYYDLKDMEPSLQKFAHTDTQLCLIEEREQTLIQAQVIRQDYPDYYEKIADFIEKLKVDKNVANLKESLQKVYRRLEPYYNGGFYYDEYPEERKKAEGRRVNETCTEEPYVRGEKKIGRNDPCPCGSGKKYEHCCLNKKK